MKRTILLISLISIGAALVLGIGSLVRGQASQELVGITWANTGASLPSTFAVDAAGTIYMGDCLGTPVPFLPVGQVPTSSRPVAIATHGTMDVVISLANGDIYSFTPFAGTPPFTPVFCTNVFGGGPTTVKPSTWGRLKSRWP